MVAERYRGMKFRAPRNIILGYKRDDLKRAREILI